MLLGSKLDQSCEAYAVLLHSFSAIASPSPYCWSQKSDFEGTGVSCETAPVLMTEAETVFFMLDLILFSPLPCPAPPACPLWPPPLLCCSFTYCHVRTLPGLPLTSTPPSLSPNHSSGRVYGFVKKYIYKNYVMKICLVLHFICN